MRDSELRDIRAPVGRIQPYLDSRHNPRLGRNGRQLQMGKFCRQQGQGPDHFTAILAPMTLEAAWANFEDLERIQRLANADHFAPWFPAYARHHATLYMMRILTLKIRYALRAYPGPMVIER